MIDLGMLPGDDDSRAYGINDRGQIVGCSGFHAVLWEPVPEPSTLLALPTGLAGIGGLVLRRSRA